MKVSSEPRPPREVVLNVEMEPADVEPYLERAYRQLVRRVNIPGFRKGKAPRRIIEQLYGRQSLVHEALDFMVPETTNKLVEQESLELGGVPSITIDALDPPTFTATVPLTPLVDLGAYEELRVEREEPAVEDDEVDQTIERLRLDAAPWEPVDEPVAMNDLINLTVYGWIENDDGEREDVVKSEETDYIPREGTRFPVPGFDEALIGLKPGETSEYTVQAPDDFENDRLAGKAVHFSTTVHQVKRKIPPALDDEFAKSVGDGFETLQALRDRIKENLLAQKQQAAQLRHEEEVLDKVVENGTFEISPLLIDHELEHYLEDREESIKTGRMTLTEYREYLSSIGKSEEEKREDARPKVEQRIKRALAIREVAKLQAVEVTDDEIDAEIESMVQESGINAAHVREDLRDQEQRDAVRRSLLARKTLALMSDLAAGKVAADGTGAAPEAAAPSPQAEGPAGEAEAPAETAKPE